jgi:methyl-accepting chemotaxis protein
MSDEVLALEAQRELLERQADAMERQTEALEAIATELRYQNAVLCETVNAVDEVAARVDDHHVPDAEPRNRSGTALQTAIADRLFERDDLEDSQMSALGLAENWNGGGRDE